MKTTQNITSKLLLLALPTVLPLAQVASQSITYAGADTTTQSAWRTSTVSKPLDPDGNNIYGSEGYLLFKTTGGFAGANPFDAVDNSLPSYLSLTGDAAYTMFSLNFPGFSDIDDPNAPASTVDSGSAGIGEGSTLPSQGFEASMFDLTFSSGIPSAGVRIGVLANNSDDDNPAALRFELDGSGGTITASATVTPAANGTANPPAQWFFFDVVGMSSGDVISFFATDGNLGGAMDQQEIKGIGGFTVDVVPEPSSAALLMGLGAAALLLSRRRG